MRAMILAAGRGERMGELTQNIPKPLLKVHGRYLIEYSIESLKRAGITEIVINTSYLSEEIQHALGDGRRFGVSIVYSIELERLETGGGIFKALPLLGNEPFIVLSADVITDYPLINLPKHLTQLAHLVVVPNPVYHPQGDFGLQDGMLTMNTPAKYTFSNIGVYHPDLFANCRPSHFRLGDLLFPAIERAQISGELYLGGWFNIGTPEDLNLFNEAVL